MIKLAHAVGQSQFKSFKAKAKETPYVYRENLKSFNVLEVDKNNVVIAFLLALVGLNIGNGSKSRYIALIAAIDCLLAAYSAGSIPSLFFALNIIMYFVSGSKTII